ncbi:hypothetical protein AK812_SmicGene37191 [Symbiodinium microadriaticum]|uniref:Uncharacterized protein n=1 Tax=Symbiodinium microadriaticum TaxID=2951 RepID=A0A1Q9CGV8_SYMMI|nr:hypothetical protein AK812_SmicGene37191 [Symbiodinium microadriaticum]
MPGELKQLPSGSLRWEQRFETLRAHIEARKRLITKRLGDLSEIQREFHLNTESAEVLSGARKVRFADVWVDLASQLKANLPIRAFVGHDPQSDRDSISRMSPPFLTRTWSEIGQHFHALIAALLMSGATASKGFTKV